MKSRAVLFFVTTSETSCCPVCQTVLLVRGTRQRVLYKNENEKQVMIIRRLRCEKCGRIHHELPDCIVPYKRYGAEPIENIITGQGKKVCGDNTERRIRGWWGAIKPYFMSVLLTLAARYGVSFNNPPAFREMVRAVVNSCNWLFSHQICTRSGATAG
ncbi:MAG: DUF6431 domain-containing protein [Clostridiales bacterium]|nr:DUF6431 domain-containing protein [Clostridiales bacterium]